MIQDIEDYKWEASLPEEGAVVFLMATYGDGEPTDSAADFYSWLVQAAEDANNGIGDDAMLKVGLFRIICAMFVGACMETRQCHVVNWRGPIRRDIGASCSCQNCLHPF